MLLYYTVKKTYHNSFITTAIFASKNYIIKYDKIKSK